MTDNKLGITRIELDRQIAGTEMVIEQCNKDIKKIEGYTEYTTDNDLEYHDCFALIEKSENELNVLKYVRDGRQYKGDEQWLIKILIFIGK